MNIRMLLPLFCLVGLIAGFLILVSPIYITGGIVCWFDPVPADAWFNHLLGMVFSVLLGLVVIAVSGVLAVTFGIVFAAESEAKARDRAKAIRDPGRSTDAVSTIEYTSCVHCGQKLSQSTSVCPICNTSLADETI